MSLQWDGDKEIQKGGLEGNEVLKINCTRGPETADTDDFQMQEKKPITMTGDFKRESGFWFKKGKNEEGEKVLGDADTKIIEFTLIANSVKKQQVKLNLAQFEGKRSVEEVVDFTKCGVTMKILVTVLPEEEFEKIRTAVEAGSKGECCIIF